MWPYFPMLNQVVTKLLDVNLVPDYFQYVIDCFIIPALIHLCELNQNIFPNYNALVAVYEVCGLACLYMSAA